MTNAALLKKVEELSARVAVLEADNTRLREENARLHQENWLLRQKLDQYIRHYFGGQRNEGLDRHQLELLLQGLANVVTLPRPEPKPIATSRNGTPHPVRRMLAEDKQVVQTLSKSFTVDTNRLWCVLPVRESGR